MSKFVWKGELGDGKIHMTALEYCEHKVAEDHEKKRQMLRKIANNPILSKDAQEAIRYAVRILDDNIWLRKQYMDQIEINDALKKANSNASSYTYEDFYELRKIQEKRLRERLREKAFESEE